MAYSELLKSFHRIRPYMRSFYVFGFRHRTEYDAKSARSYDNERRRVESWLGDFLKFGQDAEGKRVFLSVDSRAIPENPLYRAFKAKSFTDIDITLHFCLMDILQEDRGMNLREILDGLEEDLFGFDDARLPDESSLRKKLAEYESLGLVSKEKRGKQSLYRLASNEVRLDTWKEAAAFFSEAAPLGVIGSYLLDKMEEKPGHFRFKHHYILNALDSEILCTLFRCISQGRQAELTAPRGTVTALPLRIYISTQTGRQYVLALAFGTLRFFRLDLIDGVKLGEKAVLPPDLEQRLAVFQSRLWGTSAREGGKTEHVEMVIHAGAGEEFIVQRLRREKRGGTVTQLENGDWKFRAEVFDALELMPWLRTFTGRVVSLHSDNPEVERRFWGDLEALWAMYGGDSDAVQ